MRLKSKVLIIAGSDSSGGAGIQADIKTVTSLGSYAMTAITAVTAQNTTGVKSIIPIRPKEISNQIEYSAKDIRPHAIKIGMLHSKKVILAVNKSLNKVILKLAFALSIRLHKSRFAVFAWVKCFYRFSGLAAIYGCDFLCRNR